VAARGIGTEAVVIVDEVALQRRDVRRTHQIDGVALQAVDVRRTGAGQPGGYRRVGRVAQPVAARPQEAAAGRPVELAGGVIAVSDGGAARAVAQTGEKSDCIFVGGGRRDRRPVRTLRGLIAQDQTGAFRRQRSEI